MSLANALYGHGGMGNLNQPQGLGCVSVGGLGGSAQSVQTPSWTVGGTSVSYCMECGSHCCLHIYQRVYGMELGASEHHKANMPKNGISPTPAQAEAAERKAQETKPYTKLNRLLPQLPLSKKLLLLLR